MKLHESILEADLSRKFNLIRDSRQRNQTEIRFVQIFDKKTKPKAGGCYLAEPDQLPESVEVREAYPRDCLFLVLSDTPVKGLPNALRILSDGENIVPDKKNLAMAVLNEVMHIMDFYQTWEDELIQLQMQQGSLRELLEASLPVLEGTLLLLGANQTLYAAASDSPISGEYTQFRTNRELVEELTGMLRGRSFAEYDKKDEPYCITSADGEQNVVFFNIRQSKSTTHRLCCIDTGKHVERCYELLKILMPFVRYNLYHVVTTSEEKNDTLTKVLQHILTDRSYDYMEASQNLCDLGWQTQQQYLCMVISTTYVDQRKLTYQEICSYMEEHYPFCTSFPFRDDIVVFFNLSLSKLTMEELVEKQKAFLSETALKAGYSRKMTGHMNLRRQYIQATAAIDVGSRKNPYQWVHQFNEIGMDYILEQVTRRLPGYMLAHEKLLLLKEMDEKNGTEYVKTLRIYLYMSQNAVHTAKALYIHRSTFLYRLDKIRQILESDLTDSDEILYLQLSFRLLEQEEKKQKNSGT